MTHSLKSKKPNEIAITLNEENKGHKNYELCKLREEIDFNTLQSNYYQPKKIPEALALTLLKNITLEYQRYLEKLNSRNDFKYTSKEEVLYKQRACDQLLAANDVHEFKVFFNLTRRQLEKNRDTGTLKFLKGVVTVLTAGLAALFGIWSVRGKKATNKMETIIENTLSCDNVMPAKAKMPSRKSRSL